MNALINTYAKQFKMNLALNIFTQYKLEGFKDDILIYTTMINGYKKLRLFKKCWDLYQEVEDKKLEKDDVLIG